MRSGKGRQMWMIPFAGLIAYTQTHFKDEEELMPSHDYPGLAAHQKMHAAPPPPPHYPRCPDEKVEDYQRRFMSASLPSTMTINQMK
jgi:hypothetical protein